MPFSFILQQQTTDTFWTIAPLLAAGLVFYFLVLMPNLKQKKKVQQMLGELKTGDQVVTTAGIRGTITALDGETIVVRVKPDNVKLEFARSAVSALVTPESSK